jgi:uncharacterized protein (TIGR00369 family)
MLTFRSSGVNRARMTTPYLLDEPDQPGIPEGFRRLRVASPWMSLLGAVYLRERQGDTAQIGLRIAKHHLNIMGVAHGGMLSTLADNALGINISLARGRRGGQVTVSMTSDFLASAREGEWLEANVAITRMGRQLAYATCDLRAGERHILRTSAVFAFVDRPVPAIGGEPPLQDG